MNLDSRRISFDIGSATSLAIACTLLLGASTAGASTVQVTASGATHTPSSGPGSLGNSIQYTDQTDTGVITGTSVTGTIYNSYSGTVASDGRTGTDTYQSTATATLGTLHSYSSVNVTSTAGNSPFIDGDASTTATATFSDSAPFYDSAYARGTILTATVTLDVDWNGIYGPNLFGEALVQANFGVQFGNNVSIEDYIRSDLPGGPNGSTYATVQETYVNGQIYNFGGLLETMASASLYNGFVQPGTTVTQFATSDAANTAHFYITSTSPTFSVIGSDGHDYSLISAVPEARTWVLMLIGIGVLGVAARRQRGSRIRVG